MEKELRQIFPRTMATIQEAKLDGILNEFNRFCLNDLNHSSEICGWFPVFLKAQGLPGDLTELCYFEWLRFSCAHLDWGTVQLDPEQVRLAPGVQFIEIDEAASRLDLPKGLYVIFSQGDSTQARALSAAEAHCLDVVREERKFTVSQLREFLEVHSPKSLSKTDWNQIVDRLRSEGVLVCRSN